MEAIRIPAQEVEDLRQGARELLVAAELAGALRDICPGPYGTTVSQLQLLSAIETGLATLLATRRALVGRIAADRRAGFAGGTLTVDEQRFASLFAVSVGLQEALAALELEADALPPPGRHLKLDEYRELLTADESSLAPGLLDDLLRYLRFYREHPDTRLRPDDDARLRACCGSYLALTGRTAARLGDDGEHAALLSALRDTPLEVTAVRYRGFERERAALPEEDNQLLPVTPDDIVGNEEMLAAGLKLCRAVAGFDLERGENPRIVRNPVVFVLGSPGCGKTVTAHAIGNYFLDLCRRNGVPARFRIIRRTDWASHYQNKSANELLRIFQQEIFEFPGVAGVYWPDIDTAFAAREDPGIRAEEKAVLGTLFGLLDGTVGPRNGKWFMIADANFITMDEAMLSRLTQDPHYAKGPQSAEDYVTLLRDKKLRRIADQLAIDEQQWAAFGARCLADGLSGRAVDNIAGKILATVEDIEVPDDYFAMTFEQKAALVTERRATFTHQELSQLLDRYIAFEKDAEERARRERFERRVIEIRERLAAQVAAVGVGDDG